MLQHHLFYAIDKSPVDSLVSTIHILINTNKGPYGTKYHILTFIMAIPTLALPFGCFMTPQMPIRLLSTPDMTSSSLCTTSSQAQSILTNELDTDAMQTESNLIRDEIN